MMPSSACPDPTRLWTSCVCRSLSGVVASKFAVPTTPFIGVRISWLIVAKNCDLARLAASACWRALINSCSVRLRSATSAARLCASSTCRPAKVATSAIDMIRTTKIVISAARNIGEVAILASGAPGSGKKIAACIAV